MSSASEFIQIFTRLENWMRDRAKIGSYVTFEYCVDKLKSSHKLINRHSYFLESMGRLRNAIVHAENFDKTIIAEPNNEIVERFRSISELIMEPPTLLKCCHGEPSIVTIDTSLPEILRIMLAHDFSQVIIQDGCTYRLLTREGISKWLEANIVSDIVSIKETKAADVLAHEEQENCRFVGRNTDIFTFIEEISSPEKRVHAVIVTANGKKTEKPIGIATLWDAKDIIRTIAF